MLVRVKLTGSGVGRDALRPNLPTYSDVLHLHTQGFAYVLIPDDTHPELHKHASAKFEQTGHGDALIALDEAGHSAWHAHLDKMYQEHKGKFRPEIA